MNKLLVAVFDNEPAAEAGLKALRALHAAGEISRYTSGVVVRDDQGMVSVKKPMDSGPFGAPVGLVVGGLIGLLGGPVGVAIGGMTGALVGAVRDFWVAGVGLDFIEETNRLLQPGKVALVAEIEEDEVMPVDLALEAAGGQVCRRTRTEAAEVQFDHDIAAFKSEIKALESETLHARSEAKNKLEAKITAAHVGLDGAIHRAEQWVDTLKQEADAKVASLTLQLSQVKGDVKARIENRMKRVKSAYHARGAKLSQAWHLTRQALSA